MLGVGSCAEHLPTMSAAQDAIRTGFARRPADPPKKALSASNPLVVPPIRRKRCCPRLIRPPLRASAEKGAVRA